MRLERPTSRSFKSMLISESVNSLSGCLALTGQSPPTVTIRKSLEGSQPSKRCLLIVSGVMDLTL